MNNVGVVSVVIPCFNAERFLAKAIESAVREVETGEVLLIEDGSTDGSMRVCESAVERYEKVKLLAHAERENKGAAVSRNLGVFNSSCKYIAFLDADDYYLPGRFEAACSILSNNAHLDGVYEAVGTEFETLGMELWWKKRKRQLLTTMSRHQPVEKLLESLVHGHDGAIHTDGITIRKEIFAKTGPFDAHLRMTQDYAMWLKMACVGQLVGGRTDRPVAIRRIHGANRIVSQEVDHVLYTYQMWKTMADWASKNHVVKGRRQLFNVAEMDSWLGLNSKQREMISGYADEMRFLWLLLFSRTEIVGVPRYWRQLARAIGGRTVRALWNQKRCAL